MSGLVGWMDRNLYPGFGRNWDDEIFRKYILGYLSRESRILDLGAGRGNVAQMNFRTLVAHVAGVDVDAAVLDNPFLDSAEVIRIDDGRIRYDDGEFDMVFSDNVLEHLLDPAATLREVRRVLKPGGVFLAKTPNKWHYMPLVARATPLWFHRFYNRMRGRSETDTFPTVYRCNTRGAITRVAEAAGMSVEAVAFIEGRPEYLRMMAPTYLLGWVYERIVNSSARLAPLRSVMQVALRVRPIS